MRIVDQVEPASRLKALDDFNLVLGSGIDSFSKLCEVASNESMGTGMRSIACWFLSRTSNTRFVPALVKCLNDKDPALRSEAARSLGTMGDVRTTVDLIRTLEGDSSADVRFYSIYALGLLQSDSAITPILAVLNDEKEDPKLRGMAAETLSSFHNGRSVDSLIACLSDSQAEVRFWAAFALGELGARKALPALVRVAKYDQSSLPDGASISNEASEAIDKIERTGLGRNSSHAQAN
jgi:HEAT repeat protein